MFGIRRTIWRFPTAIIAIRFPRALGATEAVHGAVTQLQQPLQILQAQAAPRVQAVLQAQTVHRARVVLQAQTVHRARPVLQARVVLQDPTVHQDPVHPQEAALAEIPEAEDGK